MEREERPDEDCKKPIIEYPCRWIYKIIGSDSRELEKIIEEIVRGHDYTIAPSNISKTGRYHSLTLEVLVDDEGQRTGTYDKLRNHPAVKMVL
jgi:putative lipoic acid-binding regulatory protein